MDLATLQSRVSARRYGSLREFDNEASLIFRNCFKFNTKRSEIYQHARRLQTVYKRWCRRYLDDDGDDDDDDDSPAEANGQPASKRRKGRPKASPRPQSRRRKDRRPGEPPRKRGRPKGSRNKPK